MNQKTNSGKRGELNGIDLSNLNISHLLQQTPSNVNEQSLA